LDYSGFFAAEATDFVMCVCQNYFVNIFAIVWHYRGAKLQT
jgi:hypothetical protein